MTRINLIDPKELSDQHLMAEYRELPMVVGSLRRSLRSPKGLPKIPDNYTLNKGHVTFFYNKGKWLWVRYNMLIVELMSRGFNLSQDRIVDWHTFKENNLFDTDWKPNQIDVEINAERIQQRLNSKPTWYRWTKGIDSN